MVDRPCSLALAVNSVKALTDHVLGSMIDPEKAPGRVCQQTLELCDGRKTEFRREAQLLKFQSQLVGSIRPALRVGISPGSVTHAAKQDAPTHANPVIPPQRLIAFGDLCNLLEIGAVNDRQINVWMLKPELLGLEEMHQTGKPHPFTGLGLCDVGRKRQARQGDGCIAHTITLPAQ